MARVPVASADFLASLVDRFPNGSINVFDRELRYVFAGGQGLASAGLSPESLCGKGLGDLFSPESVAYVEPFYRRALAGESVRFDLPTFGRVYNISAGPLESENGQVLSIIAIAQDVTDAKRTELALVDTQERLKLALDVAGVSTSEVDVATGHVERSEAMWRLLGRPPNSLAPTTDAFLELVHPDDRDRVATTLRDAVTDGRRYSVEFRILRPEGGVSWLLARGEPFRGDSGQVTRLLAAMIDVTAHHELQQRLRDSNTRKDRLLAVLSHELRQPVQAALAALGVMQARIGRETGERARQTLARQVTQMSRLIEDLLDAVKAARGDARLQYSRVDLCETVRGALETVTAAQGVAHDIAVDLPPQPVFTDADPQRIQQVFVNLIGNATKYTPAGGRIAIDLQRATDTVHIRVRDSGDGIDPADLPHVFEMFSRGDDHAEQPGLGVGLAVVRGIVEQHGGKVSARSEGRGRGAEFVVSLPLR